jgi:hypothetical protein
MRRGTRDDPLFGTELVQFANERTSVRYETTALDVPLTEASVELRREIGRAMGWARTTGDRLHEAELASAGRLTVAGALYLLDDPARVLGKTFVELLRFADDTSIDYDRRHEIGGPIHRVLTETAARISDDLGSESSSSVRAATSLPACLKSSFARRSPMRWPTEAMRRLEQRCESSCAPHAWSSDRLAGCRNQSPWRTSAKQAPRAT